LLFIKHYLVFYELILGNKVINNNVLVGSLTARMADHSPQTIARKLKLSLKVTIV